MVTKTYLKPTYLPIYVTVVKVMTVVTVVTVVTLVTVEFWNSNFVTQIL